MFSPFHPFHPQGKVKFGETADRPLEVNLKRKHFVEKERTSSDRCKVLGGTEGGLIPLIYIICPLCPSHPLLTPVTSVTPPLHHPSITSRRPLLLLPLMASGDLSQADRIRPEAGGGPQGRSPGGGGKWRTIPRAGLAPAGPCHREEQEGLSAVGGGFRGREGGAKATGHRRLPVSEEGRLGWGHDAIAQGTGQQVYWGRFLGLKM